MAYKYGSGFYEDDFNVDPESAQAQHDLNIGWGHTIPNPYTGNGSDRWIPVDGFNSWDERYRPYVQTGPDGKQYLPTSSYMALNPGINNGDFMTNYGAPLLMSFGGGGFQFMGGPAGAAGTPSLPGGLTEAGMLSEMGSPLYGGLTEAQLGAAAGAGGAADAAAAYYPQGSTMVDGMAGSSVPAGGPGASVGGGSGYYSSLPAVSFPAAPTPPTPPAPQKDGMSDLGKTVLSAVAPTVVGAAIGGQTPYDPSAELAQQEAERQLLKGNARSSVNSAFSGFDDNYYANLAKSYRDYQMPTFTEQYQEARRQLPMMFSNTANSSFQRKAGQLETDRLRGESDIAKQAEDVANTQRATIESNRSSLLNSVEAGAGLENAADQAASVARSVAQPPAFSPIGELFAKYTSNLANARLAQDQGYGRRAGQQALTFNNNPRRSYSVTTG